MTTKNSEDQFMAQCFYVISKRSLVEQDVKDGLTTAEIAKRHGLNQRAITEMLSRWSGDREFLKRQQKQEYVRDWKRKKRQDERE